MLIRLTGPFHNVYFWQNTIVYTMNTYCFCLSIKNERKKKQDAVNHWAVENVLSPGRLGRIFVMDTSQPRGHPGFPCVTSDQGQMPKLWYYFVMLFSKLFWGACELLYTRRDYDRSEYNRSNYARSDYYIQSGDYFP